MADLDALRLRFPHLGFGVYAYGPGEPVTLEIHLPGGDLHTTQAPTLSEAIAAVFPETVDPQPEPEPEPETPPDPFG